MVKTKCCACSFFFEGNEKNRGEDYIQVNLLGPVVWLDNQGLARNMTENLVTNLGDSCSLSMRDFWKMIG